MSSGGQLFCFLPMPLEADSPTGLKAHVHGYFALDQNRRHVKMPSAEQRDNVVDDQLVWNFLLVRNLLPKCLVGMVLEAVRDPTINHHVCTEFRVAPMNQSIDKLRSRVFVFTALYQCCHMV